ncbi:MAG: enoyl-CoA hydratase/isomerase family protein [Planctomycetota bacterium]
MNKLISQCVKAEIGEITLSRPEIHNAFNEVMIAEIKAAFEEMGQREDVRAVILSGEGKSFSAGGDIHWMKKMVGYSFEENLADANAMANMLRAIRECPKPVIARVHGAAYGGGVGLTAACDLAIALDSAVFCLSEVKLGILPAVIGPYVLEKIGMSHMRRYGITAEKFNAQEAKRIGLVHEVVAKEVEMDAWIDRQVDLIKANGPEAMATYKQTLGDISGVDWDRVQAITTKRISERRASSEGQEGLKAFLEKRPPRWAAK